MKMQTLFQYNSIQMRYWQNLGFSVLYKKDSAVLQKHTKYSYVLFHVLKENSHLNLFCRKFGRFRALINYESHQK